GWYKGTGEIGSKHTWCICRRDRVPALIAGVTAWEPGSDVVAESWVASSADDRAGGMEDMHDRRPVCLSLEDEQAWVDQQTPLPYALEILSTPRPETAFQWWMVTPNVGNSRYQLADAAEPIAIRQETLGFK